MTPYPSTPYRELIREGMAALAPLYPEKEAENMVLRYFEDVHKIPSYWHISDPKYTVFEEVSDAARDAFARMAAGEPLQYVTGRAYFYGRRFKVTPDVLIPRPETELLCRHIIRSWGFFRHDTFDLSPLDDLEPWSIYKPKPVDCKVLDLCTGSGCIAWTLVLENPGAEVVAVDVSEGALAIASGQNFREAVSRRNGVLPRFIRADVLAGPSVGGMQVLPDCEPESFDLIVSNPPYVMESEKALMRSNVLDYEPHLALFVPDEDPLVFYRAIADWAAYWLKPGGKGIVEVNEALGPQTADVYREAGFSDVSIINDINERDRYVMFHK